MVEQLQHQYIAFLRPDETAADLFARSNPNPVTSGVPPLDVRGGLQAGQLIEVAGPSCSGKTEMLTQVPRIVFTSTLVCTQHCTQVLAHTILPERWQEHHVGGLHACALFLDLDTRFDLLRLVQILQSRLFHLGCARQQGTTSQQGTRLHPPTNAVCVAQPMRMQYKTPCHASTLFAATTPASCWQP